MEPTEFFFKKLLLKCKRKYSYLNPPGIFCNITDPQIRFLKKILNTPPGFSTRVLLFPECILHSKCLFSLSKAVWQPPVKGSLFWIFVLIKTFLLQSCYCYCFVVVLLLFCCCNIVVGQSEKRLQSIKKIFNKNNCYFSFFILIKTETKKRIFSLFLSYKNYYFIS